MTTQAREVRSWDRFWLGQAQYVASEKSKDPSTQVGCVIVSQDNTLLSQGFNGFPRGIVETEQEFKSHYWVDEDPSNPNNKAFDRWDRPQKYSWVEHAERNACFNAARNGIKLLGAKAYLNWSPNPCEQCMRALIQVGVVEIIGTDVPFAGKGKGVHYDLDYAQIMCSEAGIKQSVVTGYLDGTYKL
jgi:dCMP deaminase